MELQRALPANPASAATARRLTEDALRAWRQGDLVEVVTLLVSELVTNAVLHAGSAIDLRVRSNGGRVRVEVGDGSAVLPARRRYGEEATTGRGLGLVAMLASSWGAEPRPQGKVVWFQVGGSEPEPGSREQALAAFPDIAEPPVVDARPGPGSRPAPGADALVEVALLGLPVALYRVTQQHNDALLRELLLRSALGDDRSGTAPSRSPLATSAFAAGLPLNGPAAAAALQAADDAGEANLDLTLTVTPAAREACAELLVALDEADALARQGGLLLPAALPEVRACRQWSLGEVIAQIDGSEPTVWTPPAMVAGSAAPPLAEFEPRAVLEHLDHAVVVGDDENRVVYVNPAAERLLGWPKDELEGQRLTVIVPEYLREAHVIGYSRYLVTGEPRLIGRPVRVPARHRDGEEIQVELMLSTYRTTAGRRGFVASLRDLTGRAQRQRTVTTTSALAATSDVVALLGPAGDLGDLRAAAPLVLSTMGRHLGCQVGLLWTAEPSADELTCAAAWDDGSAAGAGFRAATLRRRFRPGVGIPGRVWASGEPVWIADVVADSNFPRASLALEHGLRSALAFPVVAGTQVRGVLELFSSELIDGNPDVLAVVAALGRYLGPYAREAE